jgi:PKD repeat protein
MSTFGKTTIGVNSWEPGPGRMAGSLYPLPVDATVSKITYYIQGYDGAPPGYYKCAIYDAAWNLQGVTEEVIRPDASAAWVDFNFPTPLSLPAGDYWLCWFSTVNAISRYDASGTIAGFDLGGQGVTYASGYPSSLVGIYKDTLLVNFSIYATYAEAHAQIPPTATFTAIPSIQYVTQPITFDASASTGGSDGYNPTTISNYGWDFGDGTYDNGVSVQHSYSTMGTKTVQLTVTDSIGQTNAITHQVVIQDLPVPSVSLPMEALGFISIPLIIHATVSGGSGTYDHYDWFENGIPYTTTTEPDLTFVASDAVTTYITVTVTDSDFQTTSPPSNICTVQIRPISEGPTLTVGATTGGSAVASHPPPYTIDEVVSVTATPATDYVLDGWLRDGIAYVDSTGNPLANPISITLDTSHTLTAVFVTISVPPAHCFIATVAFGSPVAPELWVLRRFRNECLPDGFVKAYYAVGPHFAKFIATRNATRRYVREWLSLLVKSFQRWRGK